MAGNMPMVREWVFKMSPQIISRIIFFLCILFSGILYAAEDRYVFETPAQEKRFQQLILEIRCMVCENQSIAESNAPLAADLKEEVYEQVVSGKTDDEIKIFLVERYGAEILYEPPVQGNTALLWMLPMMLLGLGFGIWAWRVILSNNR